MTLYDELTGVLAALDEAGIEYALVGALGMKARAARPQDLMDVQNLRDIDR